MHLHFGAQQLLRFLADLGRVVRGCIIGAGSSSEPKFLAYLAREDKVVAIILDAVPLDRSFVSVPSLRFCLCKYSFNLI